MVFLRLLLLTLLLLKTAAQPINSSLVFPNATAPPILTKHHLLQELSSWQNIQIFTTLLNAHPFLIPVTPSLILVPTNAAFLKLLSRLLPQMHNPLSTAASVTNLLDNLLNTANLTAILAYHIIPRDLVETDLTAVYLTASGAALSFTDFPKILDIDPVTQPRRVYRQIKAIDGSFMFLSDVVLPLPLQLLVPGLYNPNTNDGFPDMSEDDFPAPGNGTFPPMPDNATLPNGTLPSTSENQTTGNPPVPPKKDGSDFFSAILSTLSPALSVNPFASNGYLIAARTDLQIMNALIRVIPGLDRVTTSLPTHILAPTDTAFINLFLTLGKKFDLPELSLPDISDPAFLSNLTEILKLTSSAQKVWNSIDGLPGLEQIVAYHVIPEPSDYASLMEMSRSAPVATALRNFSLVFQADAIIDADPSREDAMPIASFPTMTGHVTVLNGVLTPFDTSLVSAVLDGGMNSSTPSPVPEKEEESKAACFPADGVVYTKHGVVKLGELVGGDEIRVDDRLKRHSAVFMFTHKDLDGTYDFMRIWTAAGYKITLTSGHYIHSKGSLIAAGSIRVGDTLRTIDGESAVTKVEYVQAGGLVAPHTVDGGLIVDGVLVSGYSRAMHPWIAHALLTPVRWYVKVSGAVEPFGGMFYRGGGGVERFVPGGGVEYKLLSKD